MEKFLHFSSKFFLQLEKKKGFFWGLFLAVLVHDGLLGCGLMYRSGSLFHGIQQRELMKAFLICQSHFHGSGFVAVGPFLADFWRIGYNLHGFKIPLKNQFQSFAFAQTVSCLWRKYCLCSVWKLGDQSLVMPAFWFLCWLFDVGTWMWCLTVKGLSRTIFVELIPKLRGPQSLLKLWHCDSRNLLYIDLAMLGILLLSMVVGWL